MFIGWLSFLPTVSIVCAEIITFTHTIKQPFGGSQSADDARTGAVAKAKQEVLEKAGTYLESLTVVKNNMVDRDEILALAAGVLKTEIVSQDNYATAEAFGVIITTKIDVDTSILEERIEKMLEDRTLLEKNKEAQQRIEELLAKNKQLEEQNLKLTASSSPAQQEELGKQFQTIGQGLAAVEFFQKSLSEFRSGKFSDPKQALNYLNQAIALDPDNVRAYSLRGLAYLQLNMPSEAVNDSSRAVRLRPDFEKGYLGRGHIYQNLGEYRLAIKDFTQAIRLNPNSSQAYAGRGITLLKAGKNQLACDDLKKACQLGSCESLKRANQKGLCLKPEQRTQPVTGNIRKPADRKR